MSTVGNQYGEESILDSLHKDIDKSTSAMLCQVFKMANINYKFPCAQTQERSKDCGLFAIAFATHLALNGGVNELP